MLSSLLDLAVDGLGEAPQFVGSNRRKRRTRGIRGKHDFADSLFVRSVDWHAKKRNMILALRAKHSKSKHKKTPASRRRHANMLDRVDDAHPISRRDASKLSKEEFAAHMRNGDIMPFVRKPRWISPWNRKKVSHDLRDLLGRFKRLGKVPAVSIDFVENLNKTNKIRSKLYSRMLTAMRLRDHNKAMQQTRNSRMHSTNGNTVLALVIDMGLQLLADLSYFLCVKLLRRSGDVESNPGPGKWTELCVGDNSSGFFPCVNSGLVVVGEELRIRGFQTLKCTLCAASLVPLEDEENKLKGFHPGGSRLARPLSSFSTCVEHPELSSDHSDSCSVTSTEVEEAVGDLPPEDQSLSGDDHDPPVILNGPRLSMKLASTLISEIAGTFVSERDIQSTVSVINYDGERRVIGNRNVKEVKQPFYAVELVALVRSSLEQRAMFQALQLTKECSVGVANWIEGKTSMKSVLTSSFLSSVKCAYKAVSTGSVMEVRISYVPHLVASVLREFVNPTNFETVRSSIRQRLLRLAAFPMRDTDVINFELGTEQVVLAMLRHGQHFTDGVVTVGQL